MSKLFGEGWWFRYLFTEGVILMDLPDFRVWSSDLKMSRYLICHLIEKLKN